MAVNIFRSIFCCSLCASLHRAPVVFCPLCTRVSETINLQITLHKFDKRDGHNSATGLYVCHRHCATNIFFPSNFRFTFIAKICEALNTTGWLTTVRYSTSKQPLLSKIIISWFDRPCKKVNIWNDVCEHSQHITESGHSECTYFLLPFESIFRRFNFDMPTLIWIRFVPHTEVACDSLIVLEFVLSIENCVHILHGSGNEDLCC